MKEHSVYTRHAVDAVGQSNGNGTSSDQENRAAS